MSGIILTPQDYEFTQRLLHDYDFFARHVQRVEYKDLTEADPVFAECVDIFKDDDSIVGLVPLIFQPGQAKLHEFVTDMKKRRGIVRAALVKPRQVGWSTYIQSRFHWLSTITPGFKTHTVSHNDASTARFLRRLRKLCAASPQMVTQGRQVENKKEVIFNNGAISTVATAGSPDAMRSDSSHGLHGSELPYWPELILAFAALLPALSTGRGSEGFLESSSRGKGDPWHNFIMEAQAGLNEWEVFFDAWFNHPRYRTQPPPGWQPSAEALEEQQRHDLDLAQLFFREMMTRNLRATWLFKQEYPTSIEESFQSPEDTLLNPDAVYKAQSNDYKISYDPNAPLIMGVDPARTGDRTVIVFRQGNVFRKVLTWPKMEDMRLVGILAEYLKKGFEGTPVAKCFIDYAIGEGVASRLRQLDFGRQVQTVHFGDTNTREERFLNKRIEMYMDMNEWFGDTGEHVSIPNGKDRLGDAIVSDLLAIPGFVQQVGSEKLKLVPKEDIKKKLGRSPDIADAMALTFAFPVAHEREAELQRFMRENLSHLPANELATIVSDFSK